MQRLFEGEIMGGDIYIPPKPKPEYISEYRYALWYFHIIKIPTPMKKNLMGR